SRLQGRQYPAGDGKPAAALAVPAPQPAGRRAHDRAAPTDRDSPQPPAFAQRDDRDRLCRRRAGRAGSRFRAAHLLRQWLSGDRRDAPLDRGDRGGGDQAVQRKAGAAGARRSGAETDMIVLASKSASRRTMLGAAGVEFEVRPAAIDERALEARLAGSGPGEIALALAEAKALSVEGGGRPVLGSDSVVSVGGRRFDKPASRAQAAEHLQFFSGKTMELHSAAALAVDGRIEWSHVARATLKVRELSDDFIESYLAAEWPEVSQCVGVFRIEALGPQLFESIEGDMFTVLGMPLLPVLGALREFGKLPA